MNNNLAGIIAPPPVLYLSTFFLGWGMDALFPFGIFSPPATYRWLGVLFIALGGVLVSWAFATMRNVGTSPSPYQSTMLLVTHGPFRFSRNPIYVAMTGLYIGTAFLINAWWPVFLLAPLILIMHRGVIVREEAYLASKFGDEYLAYQSKVRRWL